MSARPPYSYRGNFTHLILCGNLAVFVDIYGDEAERIGEDGMLSCRKKGTYSTFFCSATFLRIGVSILHGLHQLWNERR